MATLTQPATALLLAILLLGASCAALFPRATSPEDKAKAEASYKRGGAHFYKSEFDQAIKEFSDAIRLDPKNRNYCFFRGFAYASKRRLDKAIEDYNQAIKLKPDHAGAYYNRGLANKHLGKKAEAEADMKKGRKLGFQD
ncbi:MAG TPA: tetratricopeptide repeat protein [Verrucomicrobia bacterium]|nr:tetratricopeptide repeat protein [Verrucomicrobiota bacterium]